MTRPERRGARRSGRGAAAWLALAAACAPAAPAAPRAPSAPPEGAGWEELAAWAADGYRALGFHAGDLAVAVERVDGDATALPLDRAARAFALELSEVAPRTNVETRWILRRALGRDSADSPEAQLARDAARLVRAAPLWYDRVGRVVRVVPDHPFLAALGAGGPAARPWHLMAHEVAHALQDRREPLRDVCAAAATYEEHVVRIALLEGEAELRMLALAAALEGRDLARVEPGWIEDELARLFGRAGPSAYEAGARYLIERLRAGGWAAVEHAVLAPRVSSRDLLDPGRAPGRDLTPGVSLAPPAWSAVPGFGPVEYAWEDVVGAWGLATLLAADYPDPGELAALEEAARGWRGDRLAVARRADGVVALAWRIALADEAAASALVPFFAGAEGTVSQRGARIDFAWSPVPSLQRAVLESLDAID